MADKLPEDVQQVDTKEYVANYPGFRTYAGVKLPDGDLKGKVVDLSMYTDEGQGWAYYLSLIHI